MGVRKTIQLYGLDEKDKLIFSTLLGLLSSKTKDEWVVSDQEAGDVLVVDLDCEKGSYIANERERSGQRVIRLSQTLDKSNLDQSLSKPLRAADILRCLNGCGTRESVNVAVEKKEVAAKETAGATHTALRHSISPNTAVRMSRWPTKMVMAKTPYAARLCAVMMHHPVSIGKAAEMASAPIQEVLSFVDQCLCRGYVEIIPIGESARSVAPAINDKSNLFEKLRNKFSARS